jgi:hypothetical protein
MEPVYPSAENLPEVYPERNAPRAHFPEMPTRLYFIGCYGGRDRDRTGDLLVANEEKI